MKIDAQQKKFFLFSAFVVIAGVLIPSPAKAIFGIADIGLFDIPLMQLDALDFIDNVVMRFLIFAFVLFAESQVLVITAGAIVGWASSFPVPLGSDLVQVGWRFMVGFVNLALLIIFLAIAFSSILRLETFQMRKTLPKLIVVALLVNFSLLFVGVFVDIAQVLINTLKDAFGGGFVTAALAPLKAMWAGPLTLAVTALGLKIGLALVPIGNVVSAVGTGSLFIADLAFGQGWFLQLIVLTIFNFVAGLILLLFAFLFVARTVVISLLAIVAPLALAASVLPSTQKYWNKWLGALISWSLVGVAALFLMGLGMKLAGSAIGTTPAFGYNLGKNLFHMLFLLTYLVVVFIISKKLTAMGTDMIVAPFRKFGGEAVKKLGIPAMAETWRRISSARRFGTDDKGKPQTIEQWATQRRVEAEKSGPMPAGWRNWGKRLRFVASGKGLRYMGGMAVGTPIEALAGQATQQLNARDQRNVEAKRRQMQHRDSRDLLRIINHQKGEENEKLAALLAIGDNEDQDDMQEGIDNGKLNGTKVGEALILAGNRLGPPGYRILAKALSGFIFDDDACRDLLGWGRFVADRNKPLFGDMTLEKLRREIPEKLKASEITQGILGNFLKLYGDPIRDRDGKWTKWGRALWQRLVERPELVGGFARRPESPEGRRLILRDLQAFLNSKSPAEIVARGLGGLVQTLYGQATASAGIFVPYRDPTDPNPDTATLQESQEVIKRLRPFIQQNSTELAAALTGEADGLQAIVNDTETPLAQRMQLRSKIQQLRELIIQVRARP